MPFSYLLACERTLELVDATLAAEELVDSVSFSALRAAGELEALARSVLWSLYRLWSVRRNGLALSSTSRRSHAE